MNAAAVLALLILGGCRIDLSTGVRTAPAPTSPSPGFDDKGLRDEWRRLLTRQNAEHPNLAINTPADQEIGHD